MVTNFAHSRRNTFFRSTHLNSTLTTSDSSLKPNRKAQVLRYTFSAAIIVLLIVFARTIDWRSAWESIRDASIPLLIAATVANFSTLLFRGLRWWILLKAAGAPSLSLAMKATVAGAGLNNVLVANGGEAARVVFVTRATGLPSAKVLATVALDRVFDPVGFIALLVWGFLAFQLPSEIEQFRIPVIATAIVILFVLIWLSVKASKPVDNGIAGVATSTSSHWKDKTRAWLKELGTSMNNLLSGPRVIPLVLLTFLAWLSQLVTFALAASAAHESLPLSASVVALLLVNLSLVVRPTPGNVGLFQVAYLLAIADYGVTKEKAIAISLLIQTIQIIPVTLAGIALAPEFIFKRKNTQTATNQV